MNYKSTQNKIVIGGYERTLPIGAVLKILIDPSNLSSAADSMIREFDNAGYSVTTGKTFHLCGIIYILNGGVAGTTIAIHQGDTEDAQTLAKATIVCGFITEREIYVPVSGKSFASAKFITVKPSGTNVLHIRMIGYEI